MGYLKDRLNEMADRRDAGRFSDALAREHQPSAAELCRQYGHQFDRDGKCACGASR